MRPIDLIPPEERSGSSAPLRSGPLAYVLLAGLVALLIGVTALVLTNGKIGDRKSELAQVEREDAVARARAERLSAYTQFEAMQRARVATVASLADSRFDWERVMRELSLVLPGDVWLVGLTATATPAVNVDGGASGGALRASAPGPALTLSGCAAGQESVAGFVTALKDIDGVTRVGVESSELPEPDSGAGSSADGEDSEDCRTREFIAKFEIVVAFDAAPVPATTAPAAPAPPEEEEAGESEPSETPVSEGGGE